MRELKIPKRSGGFRTIVVPSAKRKRECRKLIPMLQKLVEQHCDMTIVHGFAELRSPVTNAARHVGYRYTLTMDIKDFFDSVKMPLAQSLGYPKAMMNTPIWHNERAAQGLPTSPMLANLAAAKMDREIADISGSMDAQCAQIDLRFVYSRYADDLTFSFNHPSVMKALLRRVPQIATKHGFTINEAKTQLQFNGAGRRIITGVAVDDALHPTRAAKRRLRAAQHNAQHSIVKQFPRRQWTRYVKTCRHRGWTPMSKERWLRRWLWQRVCGLEEWCKLKPPGAGRRSTKRICETLPATEAIIRLAERL